MWGSDCWGVVFLTMIRREEGGRKEGKGRRGVKVDNKLAVQIVGCLFLFFAGGGGGGFFFSFSSPAVIPSGGQADM